MKQFSQLGIAPPDGFIGEKIKLDKVLNQQITVSRHMIKDSRYPNKGNGMCLWMQIEFEGQQRVLFTGSITLQDQIQKVAPADFPFMAKIVREGDRVMFT